MKKQKLNKCSWAFGTEQTRNTIFYLDISMDLWYMTTKEKVLFSEEYLLSLGLYVKKQYF